MDLEFNKIAAAVLESSQHSILFVSSPRALGTPQESNAGTPRAAAAAASSTAAQSLSRQSA